MILCCCLTVAGLAAFTSMDLGTICPNLTKEMIKLLAALVMVDSKIVDVIVYTMSELLKATMINASHYIVR